MEPPILIAFFVAALLITNIVLVARHQRAAWEAKRRHVLSLQRLSEASKLNLTPTAHELIDAVIDEEMEKV